MRKKKVVIES